MKKMLIFALILIIIVLGIFVFKNHGYILQGDSLTEDDSINGKMYSHIYRETIVNNETDLEKLIEIYTFNENDICISVRMQYQFSSIETAREQYEKWKNANVNVTVNEDDEKIMTINKTNIDKNKSKQSVIEDIQKYIKDSPEDIYTWYVL
jgi:hypothetical protein